MERVKSYSMSFYLTESFCHIQLFIYFLIHEHITRYHLTPTGMVIIEKQIITRVGKDVEKQEHSNVAAGNVKQHNT